MELKLSFFIIIGICFGFIIFISRSILVDFINMNASENSNYPNHATIIVNFNN